jgi:hypothetical protein
MIYQRFKGFYWQREGWLVCRTRTKNITKRSFEAGPEAYSAQKNVVTSFWTFSLPARVSSRS